MLAVEPCSSPCVAALRFDNQLVRMGCIGPHSPVRTTLTLGDLVPAATVEHGGGMAPDVLRVQPPRGYAVEPGVILVNDNATGRLRGTTAPTRAPTRALGPSGVARLRVAVGDEVDEHGPVRWTTTVALSDVPPAA